MNISEKQQTKSNSILRTVLPVLLIIMGLAGGYYYKSSRPEIKRKPPVKSAVVVETIEIKPGDYQGAVQVMGTVIPEKEVVLKAKVSGEVVFISPEFVVGGRVKKGELLITLEDADYRIEVGKAQSALDKALSDLAIEQGSQMIAKEELKLINEASGETISATDLALRKPQLAQVKAGVKSARADLEKAKLNLSRTQVFVPFNALVIEKNVEKGSLVTSQGALCTLVDVDIFNVEAQVPPDRLAAFRADETFGSRAFIYSGYSDQTWEGKAVRTTGKMSDKSRMAGVLIEVPDPLGLKKEESVLPLLLEDHVSVRIMGNIFKNVFELPRNLVHEDQTVWLYADGSLNIRKVEVVWKEDGRVFISSGIEAGDKIITSDLPAPVNGMRLQAAGHAKSKTVKKLPGSDS